MREPTGDRIEEIFVAALDRAPAERVDFLDSACGGDARLRDHVESLLEDHEQAGNFMRPPSDSGPDALVPGLGPDVAGQRIGAYTIRRVIDSGGMGVVYEAEQEHPKRVVALKVMRPGVASASSLRRFEYEAQILARLRHPNIAQVYEAGTHGNGHGAVPYFAMEYVPGASNLIEYANDSRLDIRGRLELFVTVCQAVHHGHVKGVVHRDLKPANILVDGTGDPKIIDFGVARATDADIAVTTHQTDLGQLIGTLQYMSPEQCEADPHDVDSRSDVYALGVVLYELLCGRPPYDLANAAIPEALRLIRDEPPARPSTINRTLRGDLETITLKALQKERERRYQSANDLARDIDRYLSDQPIAARPPSVRYQLVKFARRNKAVLAGVVGMFVLLVLGTIVSSFGFIQANRQRVEAESEAAKAAAVTEFLGNMIGATDFAEAGRRLTVVQVLDQAMREIESALPGQEETQAEIRHLAGLSYISMSELDRSVEQLRAALEIRRRVLGPAHPDTLESAHALGRVLWQDKQLEEAEDVLRDVVEKRRRTLGGDHPDTLWSMSRLCGVLDHRGELDEAEALGRRSTDGLIRLLGEEDERSLRARRRLAGPLYRKGKVDEAERLYRRNHEVSLSALGEEHLFTMIATREYGTILEVQGRWEEAEPLLRWTLQGYRRLLGDDDYVSLHWMDTFGWMLYRNGEREEGERLLREGVSGLRRVMGERNLLTAYATRRLARMERDLGNHEKAVELLRHCVDVQREVLGVQHGDTIGNIEMLGSWLADRGPDHLDEAEALAREARDLSRRFRGHDDELTLESMDTLAVVLHMQGRNEEAVVEFEAVAAAARDTAGDDGWFTVMSAVHYGRCLLELDRYEEAESILLTAYNNDNESACDALIDLYEAWGQPEKAAEYRALLREAEGADNASEESNRLEYSDLEVNPGGDIWFTDDEIEVTPIYD